MGKNKFEYKKNLGKKKIWLKKIDPKRVITPKGAQLPQIGFSCFSGGDTQKSCVQSKFEAKRLKITPFITDRTFWVQNVPIPIGPFRCKIRNLGPTTF